MMVTQPNLIGMTVPGGSQALSAMRPLGWDAPVTEPAGRAERHEMTVCPCQMPPGVSRGMMPATSPAPTRWAGKQKTAPKDRFNTLISLRKSGEGEGIRTLDPNLGNVRDRAPQLSLSLVRYRWLRVPATIILIVISHRTAASIAQIAGGVSVSKSTGRFCKRLAWAASVRV